MSMPPCCKVGDVRKSINYGLFEIIQYNGAKKITVRFLDTNYVNTFDSKEIRSGNIKDRLVPTVYDVGYIGGTNYNSSNQKKAYQTWVDMIQRCYKPQKHEVGPYADSFVCKEWLNFQSFCKWFLSVNYTDPNGLDLDKDLTVRGNKTYTPELCKLIPSRLNKRLSSGCSVYGKLPRGITANGRNYQASHGLQYIGTYTTINEARLNWLKFRVNALLECCMENGSLHSLVLKYLQPEINEIWELEDDH